MKKMIGIVLMFPLLSLAATTYYVDAIEGSDFNTGKSVSVAKQTIQAAIDDAADGDVVSVAEGTYTENVKLSKRLVLNAASPLKVTVNGNQSGHCIHIATGAAGCVVDGFVLYNGAPTNSGNRYGGGIDCTVDATILNCHFKDNGNSSHQTFAGGIHTTDGAKVLIYNCLFTGNQAYACGGASLTEGGSTATFDRCVAHGNMSSYYGYPVDGGWTVANTGALIVKNCISWGNSGNQIGAYGGYGAESTINISYSCVQGGAAANGAGHFTNGPGNISGDPKFTNPDSGDFSLQPSSPCINAGSPSDTDSDGTRADMGFREVRIGGGSSGTEVTTYTITFDANGGGLPTPSAITRKEGGSYGTLPTVTRSGYAFDGWYTLANGGTKVSAATMATANVTVYAHWVTPTGSIALSDVEVFSGYPWQEVVIGYKITGSTDNEKVLHVTARDNETGKPYVCKTLEGVDLTPGSHVIKWDASVDGAKFKSDDVAFTVRIVPLLRYCVIDLSGGASATSYPVAELADAPSGGWTDEYKTTKLVLRRIEAGTFKMQNQYDVTLTKPFYIGVFEVTQKQYALVMGANPSRWGGDMRPVDQVRYDMIRGRLVGAGWPTNNAVDATSFLGKLRAKTGLDFDLPTEAQWEYACRAGTTSDYNSGGSSKDDLKKVGRYYDNRYDGKGGYDDEHTKVGSYQPNAWGLYDMHGNVREWCLDWYESNIGSATNPKGAWPSGSARVVRGGGFNCLASICTSFYRGYNDLSRVDYIDYGFRLSLPLP